MNSNEPKCHVCKDKGTVDVVTDKSVYSTLCWQCFPPATADGAKKATEVKPALADWDDVITDELDLDTLFGKGGSWI
jgi:hypothetical protein